MYTPVEPNTILSGGLDYENKKRLVYLTEGGRTLARFYTNDRDVQFSIFSKSIFVSEQIIGLSGTFIKFEFEYNTYVLSYYNGEFYLYLLDQPVHLDQFVSKLTRDIETARRANNRDKFLEDIRSLGFTVDVSTDQINIYEDSTNICHIAIQPNRSLLIRSINKEVKFNGHDQRVYRIGRLILVGVNNFVIYMSDGNNSFKGGVYEITVADSGLIFIPYAESNNI